MSVRGKTDYSGTVRMLGFLRRRFLLPLPTSTTLSPLPEPFPPVVFVAGAVLVWVISGSLEPVLTMPLLCFHRPLHASSRSRQTKATTRSETRGKSTPSGMATASLLGGEVEADEADEEEGKSEDAKAEGMVRAGCPAEAYRFVVAVASPVVVDGDDWAMAVCPKTSKKGTRAVAMSTEPLLSCGAQLWRCSAWRASDLRVRLGPDAPEPCFRLVLPGSNTPKASVVQRRGRGGRSTVRLRTVAPGVAPVGLRA